MTLRNDTRVIYMLEDPYVTQSRASKHWKGSEVIKHSRQMLTKLSSSPWSIVTTVDSWRRDFSLRQNLDIVAWCRVDIPDDNRTVWPSSLQDFGQLCTEIAHPLSNRNSSFFCQHISQTAGELVGRMDFDGTSIVNGLYLSSNHSKYYI